MTPETHDQIPANIRNAISVVRALEKKNRRTQREGEALNQARLKVAFWVCRRERIHASWDNLCFVLGSHAEAIRPAYERMRNGSDPESGRMRAELRPAPIAVLLSGGIVCRAGKTSRPLS